MGGGVKTKLIYRLCTERSHHAPGQRQEPGATAACATAAGSTNELWATDFLADCLIDGRRFRVPTVVDLCKRECLLLWAQRSITGQQIAVWLNRVITQRGAPRSVTCNSGPEFSWGAMEAWEQQQGVRLDFVSPAKPVTNAFIESFNGRLQDECVNVKLLLDLADVGDKLDRWRVNYNRPPSQQLARRSHAARVRATNRG